MNFFESLLTTDNQSRGEPTLAGVAEGKAVTTTNSVLNLFGKAADVYASTRAALDGKASPTVQAQTQAQVAVAKSNLWLWLGGGLALVAVVFLVARR